MSILERSVPDVFGKEIAISLLFGKEIVISFHPILSITRRNLRGYFSDCWQSLPVVTIKNHHFTANKKATSFPDARVSLEEFLHNKGFSVANC